MSGRDDGALHEFVTGRYRDLRRSAFLMCGDWALAGELTEKVLARYVNESARMPIEDPDAYLYADLMALFQHRRSRREHVFVAGGADTAADSGSADPLRTILILDALNKLSPRCRSVMVLRHWDSFSVEETADILDLEDERVDAIEAAGLRALDHLRTGGEAMAA